MELGKTVSSCSSYDFSDPKLSEMIKITGSEIILITQ